MPWVTNGMRSGVKVDMLMMHLQCGLRRSDVSISKVNDESVLMQKGNNGCK
jgi:hypothetical protein